MAASHAERREGDGAAEKDQKDEPKEGRQPASRRIFAALAADVSEFAAVDGSKDHGASRSQSNKPEE
jgi:hypothetical protein